jgi:hypothetical protein
MTIRRTFLILGAIGAAGLALAELREERAERAHLQDQVTALSAAQRRGPEAVAAAAAPAVLGRMIAGAMAAPREPRPAPADPPAPVDPRARLDGAFLAQQPDPAWTGAAGRLAEARIGAALPAASVLRSVECRASLCRIETEHPDLQRYQQFFQRAFVAPDTRAWNGAVTTAELAEAGDGTVHVISYLAREGAALPQGEPHDAVAGKPGAP